MIPEGVDESPHPVFSVSNPVEVLMGCQQSFEHEGGFYQVGTIILTTEGIVFRVAPSIQCAQMAG